VDCGRRWGKTEYAKRKLVEKAREGLPVAYLAPIYDQCFDVYQDLVLLLAPEIERKAEGRWILLSNGGFIRFWSMENGADRVRGKKYARVVLDEAAVVVGLQPIWERVVRATLADYQGDAFFVSTPRRGSYFETLYDKGQTGELGWMSWNQTTYDNPFIAESEIDQMRREMSEQTFLQEVMADFEASESDLVHPEFDRIKHVRAASVGWKDCIARIVGIDPGGGDPSAVTPIGVWLNKQPGALNAGLNFHQFGEFYRKGDVGIDDYVEYLGKLNSVARITKVIVAETGGNNITNSLLRHGFPAERFVGPKGQGIETVRWLLESNRLSIDPACVNSIAEFPTYKWKKSRDMESGERYATSTPEANHADAMDARRGALVWAVAAYQRGGQSKGVKMEWAT